MTKICNQYISLNNILLNQRLWICNCLYWRWQWSPDREEVRSPDAFHLEPLRFMVGADVRLWERKISVWLSCWHLTPSTCSPSWRVTRGHIRGRAETPRGRRVEPTNPVVTLTEEPGLDYELLFPYNLIIFNIITQPSWWSSSNLNQHVLVAEPLKVDHLIARWWDLDNKTWSGLGWWSSATWCQQWLLNGGLIQAKSGNTAVL